jgi:hypothetical protein
MRKTIIQLPDPLPDQAEYLARIRRSMVPRSIEDRLRDYHQAVYASLRADTSNPNRHRARSEVADMALEAAKEIRRLRSRR